MFFSFVLNTNGKVYCLFYNNNDDKIVQYSNLLFFWLRRNRFSCACFNIFYVKVPFSNFYDAKLKIARLGKEKKNEDVRQFYYSMPSRAHT